VSDRCRDGGGLYTPAMLLDAALRATVRNFSTLFLLVAVVTVPLHVGHAYAFRNVIATSELHPAIERWPPQRRVRGVGSGDLRTARVASTIITLLEIALLPLFARAAARVMAVDRRHGVPTVVGAWGGGPIPLRELRPPTVGPVVVAAALALTVGWLARAIGLIVVESLPDGVAFAGRGLNESLARAGGAAFLIGPIGWMGSKDT
jgi:hypothetical protein